MFGNLTRPMGNDSPVSEETKAESTHSEDIEKDETATADTESETVEKDEDLSDTESTIEDDDSDTDSDESEDGTEEVKKPKKGFERRIERFNRKLSAKDQEIEYWKKAALGGKKDEVQPVSVSKDKPTYDQYNDMESYTEALTDWKVEQAMAGIARKQQEETYVSAYNSRLAEFQKKTPDFQDVMDDFIEDYGDKPVPEIVQTVMESDNGPELAYYLATHTSDVDRIAELPSHKRFIELGKLVDRLSDKAKTKSDTKKVSKASPPADSVKSPGKVETHTLYDDIPYHEWVKLRLKH